MFVYTVYPMLWSKRKKQDKQVERVSRVNPVRRVKYNSSLMSPINEPSEVTSGHIQAADTISGINMSKIDYEQGGWSLPINELYIQDSLPLLLEWRYPKSAVHPDYIQKRRDRLIASRSNAGILDIIN